MSNFLEREAFNKNDIWRGEENEDFQMAFAVVDYVSGDVKNDFKFVNWYAELIDAVLNKQWLSEFPIYECTEKDYAN